ncbi:MAG: LptF/LptG family permease [Bacteroidales bacterium]|nr:LptF/LptG family permease [Bacteroidales bacterium]
MTLKPKIIDRYIMKKFLSTFFTALLIIIALVIIFDISEKIENFVEHEVPLKSIVFDYYVNFVPYFINMFSPLFVFITVIFFTSRMAANSEIVAILSGGISYHRMMVPYIVSAALIALFSLGLNLFIIPKSNASRVEFETKYVDQHYTKYSRNNVHYQIAPGQFVYVQSFSAYNNTAYKFTLETIKDNKLVSKLSADSAVWDSTMDGWHLRRYFLRDYGSGLGDRVRSGEAMDTVIALKLSDFYRNQKTVETLQQKDLNALIETQKMRGDANVMYAQIEKNRRMTLPFSAFILTIMAVALTSKKKRGGIGFNLALGIGLAFLYILFLKFSEMFVYTGTMPAGIALWIPNIVYTFIAAILYRIAPK